MSFAQCNLNETEENMGNSRKRPRDKSNDKCHKCWELSHHAYECDKEAKRKNTQTETLNMMNHELESDDNEPGPYEIIFCTGNHEEANVIEDATTSSFDYNRARVIPKGSIGLDSMSSVDIFGDERMLSNIRTTDETMRIVCNADKISVDQVGELKCYGTV